MPKVKKSWTAKLHDSKDLPRVEPISESMRQRWGAGTLLIPAPLEVDAVMRSVPYGKLTTINHIRAALACKHSATIGCPITTGIFVWVARMPAEHLSKEKRTSPILADPESVQALNPEISGGVGNGLAQGRGHTIEMFKGNDAEG
jgi:hypothetical protein